MDAVFDNIGVFLGALRLTLALTFVSAVLAIALGVVLAAFRVSPVPVLRGVGTAYVETLRNTPLTVVFFFSVFVLPQIALVFSYFTFAVIALTVYHAAFFCEAVRSGINAVGVGQAEAARSIGLTFTQTLRVVVLPQALRTVIPPLINVFIALTKNTSVAAAFGVSEVTQIARRLSGVYAGGDVLMVFLAASVLYLAITIPAGIIAGRVERKVAFAR